VALVRYRVVWGSLRLTIHLKQRLGQRFERISLTHAYETEFLVVGWESKIQPIQRLLNHLARKTKSDSSRREYLGVVHRFTEFVKLSPQELVAKTPSEVSELVQDFVDQYVTKGRSVKSINVTAQILLTFFNSNGFKKEKSLEVEKCHVPARYRKIQEYIPTKEEIWAMADSCGSTLSGMRDKAIILSLFSSGLRNSTLRALRYVDLKNQLESEVENEETWLKIEVYPEMKEYVAEACKNNIPYYTFIFPDGVLAIKQWLEYRKIRIGTIQDNDPVFCSLDRAQTIPNGKRFISKNQVAKSVKSAARRAGIKQWNDVHPHCVRKTFESVTREARSDGSRLGVKEAEFLMGHILPGAEDAHFDKTKTGSMKREFQLLNFSRETKGVKQLQDSLNEKEKEIQDLRERQLRTEELLLAALVKGDISRMPLETLEKAGYSTVKNPDGSYTLLRKQS
jgi:integrase